MSVKIIQWVWEQSKSSGNDRLLALALADHCSPEGRCWPNMQTLAKMCGWKDRTSVQHHLKKLMELGEIRAVSKFRIDGSQTSNEYQFTALEGAATQRRGEPPDSGGVAATQRHHEPLFNHSSSDQKNKGFSLEDAKNIEVPVLLQTPQFLDCWRNVWLPSRFAHKKAGPPTEQAVQTYLKHSIRLGSQESVRLMEIATAAGWRGFVFSNQDHQDQRRDRTERPRTRKGVFDPDTYRPGSCL